MLQTCQSEDRTVVVFEGSLDTPVCAELQPKVYDAVAQSDKEIEFDLSEVDFVSSSFLRLCVHAYAKAGDRFRIVNVNPMVKRVFKIAGLDRMVAEG